ncbi:MAG: hypothetical protein IJ422_06215 [Oscillospiraceae bacterium]|nr:hypothetical protein [Oscillospiraceae bacterium]
MKKLLALLLAAVMCFSFVACGSEETPNANANNETLGNNSATNGTVGDTGNNNTETGDNTTENPVLLYDHKGAPYINKMILPDLVETIELTTDNWHEYIKAYSYDTETVEKDTFGEIVSSEKSTWYRLGAGNERYHLFDGVAIELKDKSTGELTIYEFDYNGYSISADFNLDNYECTRIQGSLYFLNFPDDVFAETDWIGLGEMQDEMLIAYFGGFTLDTGTNAIYVQPDFIEYFE